MNQIVYNLKSMVLLQDAVHAKKMDVRLIERNIARGVFAQADFDQMTHHLSDDSENAAWINVESLCQDLIPEAPVTAQESSATDVKPSPSPRG